jgi:hypothetical protein
LHALAQLKHWRIKQEVCLISRRKVRGGEEKHWGLEKACVESFSNDLQLGPGALFRRWNNCVIIHANKSPIEKSMVFRKKRRKERQLQPLRRVSKASHQTTSRTVQRQWLANVSVATQFRISAFAMSSLQNNP